MAVVADKHAPVGEARRNADVYRKWARHYYLAELAYNVFLGTWRHRRLAIRALRLQPGDTVVDVCCGTGLNFPLLQKAIGPEGKIIGVDVSDAMLEQAEILVSRKGWKNVELVEQDAARYQFPSRLQAVISTWGLTAIPEFDDVIRRGCRALLPGRRWVVLDFKVPWGILKPMAPMMCAVFVRPFGGSMDMASRHPWESIENCMSDPSAVELIFGFAHLSVGVRAGDA